MLPEPDPDPILVRLAAPGAKRFEPRLDEHEVPWCDKQCPYFVSGAASMFGLNHCELLDNKPPESICVPGVRVLINMARNFARVQHGTYGGRIQ